MLRLGLLLTIALLFSCSGRQVQESKQVRSPFSAYKKKIHFNKVLNNTGVFDLDAELHQKVLGFFQNEADFSYENNHTRADYIVTIHADEFKFELDKKNPLENYFKGVVVLDNSKFRKPLKSRFIIFLDDLDANAYNEGLYKVKEKIFTEFLYKLKTWLDYNTQ